MLKNLWIVLSVCILLLSSTSVTAQSSFRKFGGCLVLDVYERNTKNQDYDRYCLERKKTLLPRQREWLDKLDLSLLATEVGIAYQIAERGISGKVFGVAGGRNVRIIIDPSEFVTAGVSETGDTIYILINAGLINMVHDVVLGVGFELAQLTGIPISETGITFSEWMELMRLASHEEDLFVPSPGPDKMNVNWYVAGLIPRSVLLEFVFAHELAHVKYGSYCGKRKPHSMKQRREVEESCDYYAIKTFAKNIESAYNLAQYLPAFQLAHASYLSLFGENYVSQGPIVLSPHAETLMVKELTTALPKRLENNMNVILGELNLADDIKPFLKQYFDNIKTNELPVLSSDAKHESKVYLKLGVIGVDWGDGVCGNVKATYELENTNKNRAIKAVVEIQSRVIARDGYEVLSPKAPQNGQNKKYRMIAMERKDILVNPNSKTVVNAELPCTPTSFAYPSVGARIVKSSWEK